MTISAIIRTPESSYKYLSFRGHILGISETEREQLQELAEGSDALARRAAIILESCGTGASATTVAKALGVSAATVRHWQQRFASRGIGGLVSERRPGAPRRISAEAGAAIQDLYARGHGTREIARRTGVSQSSVARLIRDKRDGGASAPATSSLHPAQIDMLVVRLFESLADDAPWVRFLDMLRIETGSDYCTLLVFSEGGPKPTVVLSDGTQLEGTPAYVEEYYAQEIFARPPEGDVATLSDVISLDELRKTDFYKQYLGRYGVGHVLGADIGNVRGITGQLRLSRLETHDDYGPAERAICQRIVPYLRAALDLFVKRIDTEVEKEALSATVSGMFVGSIIVDPDARILDANPPALAILEQRDGLSLSGGRLCLSRPEKSKQFHELIRSNAEASLDPSVSGIVRAILIERPSGRESISLLVRPATTASGGQLAIRPTAILHLVDPAQPRLKVIDALVQLFGLTLTEAKVALSLSNGFSVAETATTTGTSRNTVRSHVRSIFSKMGVARQTDLIRAVLISVALLSLEGGR